MATISIVVPVYKVEAYLRRCIDSILVQTYRDFELILVDDGSPDNCGKICDEYAKKDSRVIVIHQQNGGLSAARNSGIEWALSNSSSRYLTFIDSDDWVLSRYLECLYAGVLLSGSVACCGCQELSDTKSAYDVEVSDKSWRILPTREYWLQLGFTMTAWGKLYVKSLFADVRYPVGKIHEDEYVTHRILFQKECVAQTEARLYCYWRRENSITMSSKGIKRLDFLGGLEDQYAMFVQMHDEALVEMLSKRLISAYSAACSIQPNRKWRMILRRSLKNWRIRIVDNPTAYRCAYPFLFYVIWPFVRVADFIRRRGLAGAAHRLLRRITQSWQSCR